MKRHESQPRRSLKSGVRRNSQCDQRQFMRPIDGKRPDQHIVEDAEDGGVGPNAESEQHDCGDGKEGLPPKSPEGQLQIPPARLDPSPSTEVCALLHQGTNVSELATGRDSGLVRRQALAHEPLSQQRQVGLHLFVEIGIGPSPTHHRCSLPASFKTRLMTPAIRSQLSVSCISCRRPRLVMA
jgi:hypothetical protein